ncbi:MAG: hypothetical protein RPT25_06670 [Cycloclasticus sp.]|jgi:hypothetical protein
MIEFTPAVLTALLFLAKAVIAGLWMALRYLYAQHKQTREEFLAYKLHVAEEYATKTLIKDNFERLNTRLDELFKDLYNRN